MRTLVLSGSIATAASPSTSPIPAQNAWPNPPDLPLEIAVLQENFGNAVHTAFAFDLRAKKVLVTGCGPVGLMTIAVARAIGARCVYATDVSRFRVDFARRWAPTWRCHASEDPVLEAVREATDGEGVDVLLGDVGRALGHRPGLSPAQARRRGGPARSGARARSRSTGTGTSFSKRPAC